jgi:hypothetical protein
MMGKILWTKMLLDAQGYEVRLGIICQDNKSAILLETNGCGSSRPRTHHLNIWYFFVSDRIQQGDVVVEYCPTKDMMADILTKPLQGTAFLWLQQKL